MDNILIKDSIYRFYLTALIAKVGSVTSVFVLS